MNETHRRSWWRMQRIGEFAVLSLLRGRIFPRTLSATWVFGLFAILYFAVFILTVCVFILTLRAANDSLDVLFDASRDESIVQLVIAGGGRVFVCRDRAACAYLTERFRSSDGITERQERLVYDGPHRYAVRIDVWMSDSGKASTSGVVSKHGLLLSVEAHASTQDENTDFVELDQKAPATLVQALDWLGIEEHDSKPPFRRPVAVKWLEHGRLESEFVPPQIGLSARFPENYSRRKE